VKKRKAKTKPKSELTVKETPNGLPSRVTSNGLICEPAAGAADITATIANKTKKKSKSSKRGISEQSQSSVDLPHSVETATEKQVKYVFLVRSIFSGIVNRMIAADISNVLCAN